MRRSIWLGIAVAAVVLFALGIALGESLRDNPRPDLTVTHTKTLIP